MNMLLLFAIALVGGWLAGMAGNWCADNLPGRNGVLLHGGWQLDPTLGVRRGPLLVASMMAAFVVTAMLLHGDALRVVIAWAYVAFLLTVLVIDFEHRRVLNVMVGPAAVVVLALSLLPQTPSPQATLLGGLVGLGIFALVYLISRGHLGMGDVKLAGLIGLMVGYPAVVNALVAGILLAGAAALLLLLSRRATRKSTMAYAPYLALGAIAAIWFYW